MCIDSKAHSGQGCFCPVEETTLVKDRCLVIALDHSYGHYRPCQADIIPRNDALFEFSCAIKVSTNQGIGNCQCLDFQDSLISDTLRGPDNPFELTQHQVGPEELIEPDLDDSQELSDRSLTVLTLSQPVAQAVDLETLSSDVDEHLEIQSSSTDAPGFYIVPTSLPLAKNLGICDGRDQARRPVAQADMQFPHIKTIASVVDYLPKTLSQIGKIRNSLAPRTLRWVTEENQNCMRDACGDTKDRRDLEKVCRGDLSNLDRVTRHNCRMCLPPNKKMLAQHCRQSVTKEQIAIYTVCGMFVFLVLSAIGLVMLQRWRRSRKFRGQHDQKMPEKSSNTTAKKRWTRFFLASKARKASTSDQAEKGASPRKLTKKRPQLDGALPSLERVPIIPPARVRDDSLGGTNTNDHRKEDEMTIPALPVISRSRITSTGSQYGVVDCSTTLSRRNVSESSG